jgi:hypothetical protein
MTCLRTLELCDGFYSEEREDFDDEFIGNEHRRQWYVGLKLLHWISDVEIENLKPYNTSEVDT